MNNPFRFSLEYFDEETELVYYNFRYYSPELGRWLSRDPIEEQGGYNLYVMLTNNTINSLDYLGMADDDCECNGYKKAGGLAGGAVVVSQLDSPFPGPADIVAAGILSLAAYYAIKQAISDLIFPMQGKGERNYDRKNPNPNKIKTRDSQTGKKLPKKPEPKEPPTEPPLVPKKKKGC